jgi:hypothetical protein
LRPLPGGLLWFVIDQPGLNEELAGSLPGRRGQRSVLGFVFGHEFAGGGAAGCLAGRGAGFFRTV